MLRVNEVATLRIEDIDFTKRKIYVREGKYGARYAPMDRESAKAILLFIADRKEGLVFGVDARTLQLDIHNTAIKAGIQKQIGTKINGMPRWKIHFHILRHWGISKLSANPSLPDRAISDMAGHVSPEVTRMYRHTGIEAYQSEYDRVWK